MAPTITGAELFRQLEAGEVSEILDIRNKDEFAASRVEAHRPVPTQNIPVYEVFQAPEAEAMERFVEEIVSSPPDAPEVYDTIGLVNAGRLAPPADEIDILDVGRNQCAASTTLR